MRFIPILLILILMTIVFATDAHHYLSFENLKQHRETLQLMVDHHPILAPLLFIGIYVVSTALSIPGGAVLSILGGFMFSQPFSTMYVVTGATIGASLVYFAAKTAMHDILKKKANPFLQKMQKGFQENAANYLLFLRLIPLFPFWLVNIAPAFFGVGLITFVWTTFIGIVPGSFVLTQAGTGLGAILDAGGEINIHTIFNFQMRIALIALGLFAILPILIKRLMRRNTH
jgi:uncharacterized membrane protein YdjX (TVP38/TMEM64 family)